MINNREFDFIKTFPPLGHPEHHFNRYPDHPWLKTKEKIRCWLLENQRSSTFGRVKENSFVIHEDLTVEVKRRNALINISGKGLNAIPVQFRCAEEFLCYNNNLTTLIGSPYVLTAIYATENKIKNLIGLSEYLVKVDIRDNDLIDFTGMCNFKSKDVNVNVYDNKITSTKGFTSCKTLRLFQSRWCDESSFEIIKSIINKVDVIKVSFNTVNEKGELDFFYLITNEQSEIDKDKFNEKYIEFMAKKVSSNINTNLDENNNIKRRKI